MLVEKLRSLLKFGPLSTRYKDIFDICYLSKKIDDDKLRLCLNVYIFEDEGMRENNIEEILKRLNFTFKDKIYLRRLKTTDKNWMDEDIDVVLNEIIVLFTSL